ncbi:ATP-binding protein [Nocardioides montaniterrae]
MTIGGSHGTDGAHVELRLPADGAYVSVLRTLTAGLAARLDFTIDDIEDLRIAVSEAVAMVLTQADVGTELVANFDLRSDRLTLVLSAGSAAPAAHDEDSFGWQVLKTLTAEASVDAVPGTYAVRLVSTTDHDPEI